jgi:hypothetical protein
MLETTQERMKLLRAGFTSKTIEKLYIEGNNFKLVRFPIIVELVELSEPPVHSTSTDFKTV